MFFADGATLSIFVGYSVSTKQNFVYDRSATTLHHSRDVVFRDGKRYTAPNAAGEAILNEHHYRDVIEEPKPTEVQPTSDENSKGPTKELLDDDSPPDPLKPKQSREMAGLETSLGDAWKPPAEGNHQNYAGKEMLAEPAQFTLEGEAFEDMIFIYAAIAVLDHHEDGIDPKSYKAGSECPLAE
jgi:hypothetical protein